MCLCKPLQLELSMGFAINSQIQTAIIQGLELKNNNYAAETLAIKETFMHFYVEC